MDKPTKLYDSTNHHSQIYLKTFFQDHFTLKARIALLTLYKITYPRWLEVSLLVFEYLQLISQIILFLPDLSEVSQHRLIFKIVTYACKLINPSYLLTFENTDSITQSILAIIFISTVLKYFICLYILAIAYWKKKKRSETMITLWRLIFRGQGRIWCYFISSFWVRTIVQVRDEGFSLYGMTHTGAIIFMSFLWTIEYIFAFTMETQYCDVLPNKNFLSAKNYHHQLITLTQKFALHILQLALKGNLKSRIWVSSLFALMFSVIRTQNFFATLPLYKLKALFLQVSLNSVVLALSISYLFQAIIFSSEYAEPNIEFIITTGFLLSLLLVRVSRNALQEFVIKIFSTKIAKNYPDLLMHKTIFLKQLMKNEKLHTSLATNYHWTFLASQIVKVSQESLKIDSTYLEKLIAKFPKHRLTQLYFSSTGIKHLKISSKALKTIGATMKKPWSTEYLSSFFLLCKFREVLTQDSQEKKQDILDLTSFIKGQRIISELKQKMIDQAELQISICQNILKDKCDIGEIFDKAQTVAKLRKAIHKEVSHLSSKLPDYSIEHLLLCAEYYLVLEYSQNECQKYCENYQLKFIKYKKFLFSPKLAEENLYQSSNAFLILAGQSKENGKIKYCSKSGEKVLGINSQDLVSSNVSTLFLPSMQSYYRGLFKQIFEKDQNQNNLLNQTQTVFLCHKKGHITESQIYLQVHPYLNENIYLSMMIRNNSNFNDYLILKENGDIEGATKRISKLLGLTLLSTSSVNIKHISEDLTIANEAFNMISGKNKTQPAAPPSDMLKISQRTKSQHHKTIDSQTASELHSLYSSEGKVIQFSPLNPLNMNTENSESQYTFHCNIRILSFGDSSLKIFKLIKVNSGQTTQDEQHEQPKIPRKPSENYIEEELETNSRFKSDANLLSPRTQPDPEPEVLVSPRLNSNRRLLSISKHDDEIYYQQDEDFEMQTEMSKFEDSEQKRNLHLADFLSVTTISYKNTQEKAIYKAYRKNINKKSYSKSFQLLCVLFYGVMVFTLLSQIILKVVYDNTMEGLVIRKDLLNPFTVARPIFEIILIVHQTIKLNENLDLYDKKNVLG